MRLKSILGLFVVMAALTPLVIVWGVGAVGNAAVGEYSCYCSQPELRLTQERVYWSSMADYTSRTLSVDYDVSNDSLNYANAHNLQVLETIDTAGVYSVDHGRNINMVSAGECELLTLKYHVPAGLARFHTRVHATTNDQCGNSYGYGS